jgi:hypothetical protein
MFLFLFMLYTEILNIGPTQRRLILTGKYINIWQIQIKIHTMIQQHEPHYKSGVNSGAPKR